jgi:DNA-binding response OmpR family regulator
MNKIFVSRDLMPYIEKEETLLHRNNVKLYTTETAEAALALHRKERMDLMVADLNMPEMGGDKLCATLREDENLGRVYFIIICTGRKDDLKRCETCGANSFIVRPFDIPEIIARVGRLLEIPRRQDLRVLVKVTVQGSFRQEPFFCTSRDVSASGILVETDKTLARGDVISCSFFLPNTDRVNVEGEVARVIRGSTSAYSYGIKFVEPTHEARARIKKFISIQDTEGEEAEA